MKLYSYVVARDYGFAPNPFNGYCTLATCKPKIRGTASVGDWVIGTGPKTHYNLKEHLIYAMQVDEVLSFTDYWNDPRFFSKRPVLNGSLKQLYGDNIYCNQNGKWLQANSHHSRGKNMRNLRNIKRDTGADKVLIAKRFVYFGKTAPLIPEKLRNFGTLKQSICQPRQGHRVLAQQIVKSFEQWLIKQEKWGVCGMPLEFDNNQKY